jgi:enoyl-CoA hydratase
MATDDTSETSAANLVTIRRCGAVGVAALNQPGRLNPLSTYPGGSEQQLADAILELDRDDSVKVIVVTGEGRAFSSGADGKAPRPYTADIAVLRALSAGSDVDEARGWAMWYVLERCTKPLIAAVHGWCIGGGWEVALWCDMIIADTTARFALTEIDLGLFPAHATAFLARAIGRWKAAELSYSGRVVDAKEAEALGLLTALVPEGEDVDAAIALGTTIAKYPLPALAAIRRALNRATITTSEWEQNRRDFALVSLSDSAKEWGARWRRQLHDPGSAADS